MKTYDDVGGSADRDRVLVDVAEFQVAADDETLAAYGLGACLGVALYDPDHGVGGLAHAMLPREPEGATATPGKFVGPAVERLLRTVVETGAALGSVDAVLVGGGDLLDLQALPRDVGERNVAAARERLAELDVSVAAADVGGDHGRTVELDTATGIVSVFTADQPVPTILYP